MRRTIVAFCLLLFPIDVFGQGPLLWEVKTDLYGDTDVARAVALSGKMAVVVGNSSEPQEGADTTHFVVQALQKATGALRWRNQGFLSQATIEPLYIASRDQRAFAVGTRREPGTGTSALLVGAYDVPSGALLWEDVWMPSGPGVIDADHPTHIVAGPTAVVVIGHGTNETGDGSALLVRAYDPMTGAVLWEDRAGSTGLDLRGWTAAINRNQVFVGAAASPAGAASPDDLILRAYDVLSGEINWEVTRPGVRPFDLELAAGHLIVAGAYSNPSTTFLAAFTPRKGAPLWEDTAPVAGSFTDIAVKGTRLMAITSGQTRVVRSYDLITGSVEWQDLRTGQGEFDLAIDLNDNVVGVAGFVSDFQRFTNEFMVRAYDAHTGALLWDDRSDRAGGEGSVANSIVLGKNRLFAAGYATTESSERDFLVRAFDIRVGRFVDLGPVVRDTQTNLIWEKKVSGVDLHGVDLTRSWCEAMGSSQGVYCAGNAVSWIAEVNAETFAGFNDWRMPTVNELSTIIVNGSIPTIDPIFGPTQPADYWSATESSDSHAIPLNFLRGDALGPLEKFTHAGVRAVRSVR